MVRRSTVDRSPQPDLYSAGYDPGAGNQRAGTGKRPRSGSGWRGAGGRWLVWTFRVVVWAVLLIIGYRGVTAILLKFAIRGLTCGTAACTDGSEREAS